MKQQFEEKAIYKIENLINHKIYIGQSIHPEQRFNEHCYNHENDKVYSMIGAAIKKYGKENFSFEILGWFKDYNEKEKYFIQYYNSLSPNGYNMHEGGNEPPKGVQPKVINKEIAEQIQKDLLDYNIPRKTIVNKYRVTPDIVRHINDGTSWKNEELIYPLRPGEKVLNEIKADKIKDMLKNTTLSHREIGQKVGWNKSAVTMINIGKNHFDPNIDYPIRK